MNAKKKAMKKILQFITSLTFAFLIVITNVTCIGPGYQPELPKETEKLKIK